MSDRQILEKARLQIITEQKEATQHTTSVILEDEAYIYLWRQFDRGRHFVILSNHKFLRTKDQVIISEGKLRIYPQRALAQVCGGNPGFMPLTEQTAKFINSGGSIEAAERTHPSKRPSRKDMGCCNFECKNKYCLKDLKKCALCKLVSYCSRTCQTVAWKAGHNKLCAVVRKDHEQIKLKNDVDSKLLQLLQTMET